MKQRHGRLTEVIFFLLFLLIVVVTICVGFSRHDSSLFNNEPVYSMNDGWKMEFPDGTSVPATLPIRLSNPPKEGIRLSKQLPEQLEGINSICIRSVQEGIEAYIGNKQIYSFGMEDAQRPFGKSSGNAFNIIRLPSEASGQEIILHITFPYNRSGEVIHEVTGGTKASLLFHIIRQNGLGLLISAIIFILGIFILAVYYIVKHFFRLERPIKYLAWFSILVSIWLASESKLGEFFTGNGTLIYFLAFESLMLFPIPLLLYIGAIPRFHYKKVIYGFVWLFIVNDVLLTTLQLFNIVDFYRTFYITHILIAAGCLFLLISFLLEIFRYKNPDVRLTGAALLFLLAFSIVEFANFYFTLGTHIGVFMYFGILIFIVVLLIGAVSHIIRLMRLSERASYYQKLAMTDTMTQCKNRTAYLNEIEKLPLSENIAVILTDVNNLKKINDSYGHVAGDQAIINSSKCLCQAFKDTSCYRIGGDEFLCIVQDWTADEVDQAISEFIEACEKENNNCPYEFHVAIGYAFYSPNIDKGIMDTIERADKKMYLIKGKMKKNRIESF